MNIGWILNSIFLILAFVVATILIIMNTVLVDTCIFLDNLLSDKQYLDNLSVD